MYIQQYVSHDQEQIEFFFDIKNTADYVDIDLTKTSHGMTEIAEIAYIAVAGHELYPKFLQEIDFTSYDPSAATQFFSYL